MKFFIVVTILMLVVMEIGANPITDGDLQGQHAGALGRAKRATCDLFSALGVEDSLCAAHCLAMWFDGYRGGHCAKGVCVCRK